MATKNNITLNEAITNYYNELRNPTPIIEPQQTQPAEEPKLVALEEEGEDLAETEVQDQEELEASEGEDVGADPADEDDYISEEEEEVEEEVKPTKRVVTYYDKVKKAKAKSGGKK